MKQLTLTAILFAGPALAHGEATPHIHSDSIAVVAIALSLAALGLIGFGIRRAVAARK